MEIRRIPLEQITVERYNPRRDLKPGDPSYEALRRSVMEFGLVEPLIWNQRTGVLVGGHQRLAMMKIEGLIADGMVDVSVVDLDPPREKALNIALNRVEGEWEREKFNHLLLELAREDLDLVRLAGFGEGDIQALEHFSEAQGTLSQFDSFLADAGPAGDPMALALSGERAPKPANHAVQLAFTLTTDARDIIVKACRAKQAELELEQMGDALTHICQQYLAQRSAGAKA